MISRFPLVLVAGTLFVLRVPAQPPVKPRTVSGDVPLPDGPIPRLGTLRLKHTPARSSTIDAALYSPDGTKIVSLAYVTGTIRLWNAATGEDINGPWSTSNRRYSAV